MIPEPYKWLEQETSPRILVEALKLYGIKEIVGKDHNPEILGWASEIGGWIEDFYTNDEIPWCGLFIAVCAQRAKFKFNQTALSAMAWVKWGNPADRPMLGDVMIFKRESGGHVGLYVAEDDHAYHILGGNQKNMVNIMPIAKDRFHMARRCPWVTKQPDNVRSIKIKPTGTLSINEA